MKVGTKSVLFGAHQFLIHPWFVAAGWWKLYGFPSSPWLWVAFFVHDLGYLGQPNMDGPEGEQHPRLGAAILYRLQGWWIFWSRVLWKREPAPQLRVYPLRWWHLRRKLAHSHLLVARERVVWGNEVLFHSRFLAKQYGARPSRLCVADKLAIVLTPAWLYLPMVRATGEIREYMALAADREGKYASEMKQLDSEAAWYASMQSYVRRWVDEHKDGRDDTWTGAGRVATDAAGVWK